MKIEVIGISLEEVLRWMEEFMKSGFEVALDSSEGRIWIDLRPAG